MFRVLVDGIFDLLCRGGGVIQNCLVAETAAYRQMVSELLLDLKRVVLNLYRIEGINSHINELRNEIMDFYRRSDADRSFQVL